MRNESSNEPQNAKDQPIRAPYERPAVTKKRSVARVTLSSGGGTASSTFVSTTL